MHQLSRKNVHFNIKKSGGSPPFDDTYAPFGDGFSLAAWPSRPLSIGIWPLRRPCPPPPSPPPPPPTCRRRLKLLWMVASPPRMTWCGCHAAALTHRIWFL
ncbi:UNVERIFIED_CONTAM: hypothetical protein Sangu_2416900 [Sesamum angustifolium]|uniref:Uncharacterized protein n=1 Tax=Sesamum angustifolium TaxID=2727405 RepID=A0AAW2KW66_9LAMI